MPGKSGPHRRARKRPPGVVHEPHAELSNAALLDAGERVPSPGGVGLPAGIVDDGTRQVGKPRAAAVVRDCQVGDLESLRPLAELEGEHRLVRDRLDAREEGHVDPPPLAVDREAAQAELWVARRLVFDGDNSTSNPFRRQTICPRPE